MSVRALILQHDDNVPPGFLGEWMAQRGIAAQVVMVPALSEPFDPRGVDVIATLGSIASVCGPEPWVPRETAILREGIAAAIPILGVCFGGQALAAALGGTVSPAGRVEIGWITLETDDPSLVPPGPWLSWHSDTFSIPPGATELARSALCPHAFTHGPHLGLQFHPEASAQILAGWAENGHAQIEGAGLDADRLVADARAREPHARRSAFRLFDAFWSRARA